MAILGPCDQEMTRCRAGALTTPVMPWSITTCSMSWLSMSTLKNATCKGVGSRTSVRHQLPVQHLATRRRLRPQSGSACPGLFPQVIVLHTHQQGCQFTGCQQ
jgi:hypothetical protein